MRNLKSFRLICWTIYYIIYLQYWWSFATEALKLEFFVTRVFLRFFVAHKKSTTAEPNPSNLQMYDLRGDCALSDFCGAGIVVKISASWKTYSKGIWAANFFSTSDWGLKWIIHRYGNMHLTITAVLSITTYFAVICLILGSKSRIWWVVRL